MVPSSDSQDVSAFPHACARLCVCRCVGSLSLARTAWICHVSTTSYKIKSLQRCLAGIHSFVPYSLLLQLRDRNTFGIWV